MSDWYEQTERLYGVVTTDMIRSVAPSCKDIEEWAYQLDHGLVNNNITDSQEVAMFLAQCSHESQDFNRLEENLNYSAKRLMEVWPSRFKTLSIANKAAGDPKYLANIVYGGRLGNDLPDDGWNYRGSGIIQLTGRYNFEQCAEDTGMDIVDNPELLREDKESAVKAACWYWLTRVRNKVNVGNVGDVTKAINGGTHGLEDRRKRFERVLKVM